MSAAELAATISAIASGIAALISFFTAWRVARMQDRRSIVDQRLLRLRPVFKELLLQMRSVLEIVQSSMNNPSALTWQSVGHYRQRLAEGWVDLRLAPETALVETAYSDFYSTYLDLLSLLKKSETVEDGGRRREIYLALHTQYERVERAMRFQIFEVEDTLYRTGFFDSIAEFKRNVRARDAARRLHARLRAEVEAAPVTTVQQLGVQQSMSVDVTAVLTRANQVAAGALGEDESPDID